MFSYYIDAFKKIKDFSSKSTRKELNYYILSWIVILLIFNICFGLFYIFGDKILSYLNATENNAYNLYKIILFWFNLLNYIVILPLLKRRMNDLTLKYANIIFILFISAFLFFVTWPLWARFILMPLVIKFSLPKFVHDSIMYFALSCGFGIIATELTLMIKK